MPRKNYVDTRHDRYKIVYMVRRPFNLSVINDDLCRSEHLPTALDYLTITRGEGFNAELYEVGLFSDDAIHWIRMMDPSEYTTEEESR